MQIIVDLDGTLCTEEKLFSRSLAKPIPVAIKSVNKLFQAGHTIIIYSSRSWIEYEMTYEWLKKNKVSFHQLVLGKPQGDIWIDDRSVPTDDWNRILNKIRNL